MKILCIIDCQNDFIDGTLGSSEAKEIVSKIIAKLNTNTYNQIYCTMDTHGDDYFETLEGKKLPVEHCNQKTIGWQMPDEILEPLLNNDKARHFIINKPTFGTFKITDYINFTKDKSEEVEEIEICGLCTDICVISNALILRAAYPNAIIKCDAKACAGTSIEAHKAALTVMKSCQIDVYNED